MCLLNLAKVIPKCSRHLFFFFEVGHMHWSSVCMTRTHMSRVCPVFFFLLRSPLFAHVIKHYVDCAFWCLNISPSIIASLEGRPKVKSN